MAGTLTKLGIGAAIFAMIFTVFIYAMVQMGNQYGVTMESTYNTQDYYGLVSNNTDEYEELTAGTSIDQQTTDTAQYQQKLSSENSKVNFWGIFTSAISDFGKMFPMHPVIAWTLGIVMTLIIGAAFYYALTGRQP